MRATAPATQVSETKTGSTPRVCYFGTYDPSYPRNRVNIRGLRLAGVEVLECNVSVWRSPKDKLGELRGWGSKVRVGLRYVWGWVRLSWRYLRLPEHDIVVVGYIGYLDVFPAKLLALLRGRRVVLDLFQSLYEMIVVDKALVQATSFVARLAAWAERLACHTADSVWLNTRAEIEYLAAHHGVDAAKCRRLLMGADSVYQPRNTLPPSPVMHVVYAGQYIPVHGLLTVVEAMRLLRDEAEITFELIGDGQEYAAVRQAADAAGLANVIFHSWMPPTELVEHLARADVCLGIFGTNPKAGRVMNYKVLEGWAMEKAVVTRQSAGITEIAEQRRHLLLIPPGDAEALASALRLLHADPKLRHHIAVEGRQLFERLCSAASVGEQALALLREQVTR